jgi:hypothetical protein
MPKPARTRGDDLFELFPDLPRPSARSREEQVARLRRLLNGTRARAAENVHRQQQAVAEVRLRLKKRQAEMLAGRVLPRGRRG